MNHDYSKRDYVRQYPDWFVSSRPEAPVDKTSYDLPHLDLRYESNNQPIPESSGLINENTRAYEKE